MRHCCDRRLHEVHNRLAPPPTGATLSKFTYVYDRVGNIDFWTQQRASAPAETYDFTYDPDDQLIFGTPNTGALPAYEDTYDRVGNRLWHIGYGAPMLAAYDTRNRILTYGAITPPIVFTHDRNGNMTAKDAQTYAWDAADRLVQVTAPGGSVTSFTYDAWGRRATKTAGGLTSTYLYDGMRLIEERRGSNLIRYFDGPGIDEHLAQQDGTGTVTYYFSDHLGSITDATTASGAVTLTRKYDPWGEMIAGANSPGYAFTGREWDPETGLYYYRARYYDPKIGRFISEDPIGFTAGVNFYAYVDNNPVRYVDPTGLAAMGGDITTGECWLQAAGAAGIFRAQEIRMEDNNARKVDKYFHCMANCEAAKQGRCGKNASHMLSYVREVIGAAKLDPPTDINEDMSANSHGRTCPAGVTCYDRCKGFLPTRVPPGFRR